MYGHIGCKIRCCKEDIEDHDSIWNLQKRVLRSFESPSFLIPSFTNFIDDCEK